MESMQSRLISRGVELWCRKLRAPVFDNGDKSEVGGITSMLASTLAHTERGDLSNMDDRIEKFRENLTAYLLRRYNEPGGRMVSFLGVDYGPDKILADSADAAGIPYSLFSYKSTVYIGNDCVSAAFGYGCEHTYHYPLEDGRWLVTKLHGSDIVRIIDQIVEGNNLGFEVEEA